jgi:hypothetical protein
MRRFATILLFAAVATAAAAGPAAGASGPKPPVLGSPASKARVSQVPSFTWSKAKGAATYEYQVSATRSFTSIVLGKGPGLGTAKTANTAATLTDTLPDGNYFWRVRSISAGAHAGAWSATRTFIRDWSDQPSLLSPHDDFGVAWPITPLVLQWSIVPGAFKYRVVIATDPGLSAPVVGTTKDPVETRAASFAPPGTLAPGRYYWAITPLDVDGHPGRMSRVGAFTWSWNTATQVRLTDLNDAPGVLDPQFSWDVVPGAAKYEVEVNSSEDFAPGSKVCCDDAVTGTSLAPQAIFPNNTYYWRMRALDASGNGGQWNNGTPFEKDFDKLDPSIPNLTMRDINLNPLAGTPTTSTPLVTWDPVPGASSYEVEMATKVAGGCDWATGYHDETQATGWAPLLSKGWEYPNSPGPGSWGLPTTEGNMVLMTLGQYCIRVLARSDRPGFTDNGFVSDWTYINGAGNAAYTYAGSGLSGSPSAPFVTPASSYLQPQSGILTPRIPILTWNQVPGARGYYVVISKDASFTTVADYAFVKVNAYAPGSGPNMVSLPDESTNYYWAVFPAANDDGSGVTSTIGDGATAPQPFSKRSTPPGLIAPAAGEQVGGQPAFRWTPAEGARRYHLQVAQDPTFSNPIDDVTTSSTAYTSSSTYPADADIYWRVRAEDEQGTGLTWSPTGSFRRRLATPTADPATPAGGSGIPTFSWSPVAGAVGYDVHVEQADGTRQDFSVASPAFTPTAFFGTGVFTWSVRASFPTKLSSTVSGGYTAPRPFTRNIPAPGHAIGTKTLTRRLISWSPVPAAEHYHVDVSATNSFADTIDSVDTDNTSWAPDLSQTAYADGGTLYWRVFAVDEGRAEGSAAVGRFTFLKRIDAKVLGFAEHGKAKVLTVKLADSHGASVTKALVHMTGPGIRRSGRTDKHGRAKFRVHPRRKGTIVVKVSKHGYRSATTTAAIY